MLILRAHNGSGLSIGKDIDFYVLEFNDSFAEVIAIRYIEKEKGIKRFLPFLAARFSKPKKEVLHQKLCFEDAISLANDRIQIKIWKHRSDNQQVIVGITAPKDIKILRKGLHAFSEAGSN